MRKGEPVKGVKFFELLSEDADFCKQLGRAVLAASRLETELKRYLSSHGVRSDTKSATLGRLIKLAREHELLVRMLPVLETIKEQRNYLAHNIHALFSGVIEETILPRTNLLDSDIDVFTERAWQLAENLIGLSEALEVMTHAPNKPT